MADISGFPYRRFDRDGSDAPETPQPTAPSPEADGDGARGPDGPAAASAVPDTSDLIACPSCDALFRVTTPGSNERAVCTRCHHVLITPRAGAVLHIVSLALTVLVLLKGAIFLPFLEIKAVGFQHASSVFDAALAFRGPLLVTASLLVMLVVIGIPFLRVMLTLYVMVPLMLERRAMPYAARAFRLSENLRPWAMAEIFIIGVGVALVKIAALARIEFGPAFFLFAMFVVVSVLQDGFMCRWSIWAALDQQAKDHAEPRS